MTKKAIMLVTKDRNTILIIIVEDAAINATETKAEAEAATEAATEAKDKEEGTEATSKVEDRRNEITKAKIMCMIGKSTLTMQLHGRRILHVMHASRKAIREGHAHV
jgi:hypothetical protein